LRKQREANKNRQKEEEDKLAAQWAKMELDIDYDYSQADLDGGLSSLATAARFYDPSTTSLSAFDGNYLAPSVFREMLKRLFNIRLSGPGL